MAFADRPLDDLVRLAHAGAGFSLNGAVWPLNDLVRIAHAASEHKGRLTFSGIGHWPLNDLVRISHAGKGAVVFVD